VPVLSIPDSPWRESELEALELVVHQDKIGFFVILAIAVDQIDVSASDGGPFLCCWAISPLKNSI
jgi:hypothetical protein